MPTFSSGCGFYGGPWPTPAPCQIEVASSSRYTNIKGEPQKFWGAPIAQGHVHFFSGVGFYD